jgi:hypothetical protein
MWLIEASRAYAFVNRIERSFFACGVIGCVLGVALSCNQPSRVRQPADPEHIQQLVSSMPPDSELRNILERGGRGDGERYPWMDLMKHLGVRRARILTEFRWFLGPKLIHIKRVTFFNGYDSNCAQITDPAQLRQIDAAGLTKALSEFAAKETADSDWTYFEHRPKATHGISLINVGDDPWLPLATPRLYPAPDSKELESVMIDGNVTVLEKALSSSHYSQDELNSGLTYASEDADFACSIKLLVQAGVDPNVVDGRGWTPLMVAADAGATRNVKTLLDVGADPRRRNTVGENASSIAQTKGHGEIADILKERASSYP